MQWTGLPIATVLGVAGFVAVFITLLYLLRLRKRRVQVPYSALWGRVLAEKKRQTDWWRRFKRLLSWLLFMIIAALITVAALGPRSADEVVEGRHLLIMLDTSASMGATDVTGGLNRFEVARTQALELLGSVGGDDRVMVALFNNRVMPLGPFVRETQPLEAALRAATLSANATDFRQALSFARDSLRDRGQAELIVLSDGAGLQNLDLSEFDPGEAVRVRHIAPGERSENLAITGFNARRYPSNRLDHEVFVEVSSTFDRPVEARLELLSEGRIIETLPLELSANQVHRQFYPGQAFAGERLEARVRVMTADAEDVFPLDDRAYAVLPQARKLRVQVVSTGNLFLEGPLLLNTHIEVTRVNPERYDPQAEFDVTFFDNVAPTLPVSGDLVFFNPPAESSPIAIRDVDDEPILTDVASSHPLMRWINLQDLNIARTSTFRREASDTAVASAFGQAVIVDRELDGRRLIAVGFDLRESDFPLRVAFPIFILNIIDYLAQDDVDLMYAFETGRSVQIPVARDIEEARVTAPDGEVRSAAIHRGEAVFYTDQPGFYVLTPGGGEPVAVAANLASPEESRIAPSELQLGEREVSRDAAGLVFERREIWIWLVLLAMGLLLLEWLTYNRRWTE
ncbi:VWA domain-containing protein [Lujinxingia vulgaris]|uniref:VWA domain-containing protein n=1 Tax=Lujinxingia vulgaris TaxID=2600176 RepID=A0A5C6X1R3_9DELT|nr:VWA domain-containing protein [Lujinxingia vulgaris]TXD35752.1 VWA domain-containing protein [Lujinxingia vulgaris]